MLKKLFIVMGVIGFIFILGAAGTADVSKTASEHMFSNIALGTIFLLVAFLGHNFMKNLEEQKKRMRKRIYNKPI